LHDHDLLSISQFAKITGMSRSALIYYDEKGIFAPLERGENNYRYYSPQQAITINLTSLLTKLNVPLKDIRQLTQSRTPEQLIELLTQQEQEIAAKMQWMEDAQRLIATFRALIQTGLSADEAKVSVEFMEATPIVMGPPNHFEEDSFYRPFAAFCRHFKKLGVNLYYPVGGYFENVDTYRSHPASPNNFFFFNPTGEELKPAGRYLVGYTRGYYGVIDDLPARLWAYAESHNLQLSGPVYHIYLLDEISTVNPNNYLLQVSASID
jgi:DNA-binding transcriptional MerR regulator